MIPILSVLLATSAIGKPVLWNSGRPWVALLETGIDFEHKIIDLKNKPTDFVKKYQQANGGSGSGLVPLLENGDDLVIESDVVAKYVAAYFDASNTMYPGNNPTACNEIESFLEKWETVTSTYYNLLRATSLEDSKQSEQIFMNALESCESDFSEEGKFLLGDDFSVAECICAPWIQRFYVTLPYFRGIPFEECIGKQLPKVARWMSAVRKRPSVEESKCPEDEMIAACLRYYVSYVNPGAPGHL